MTWRRCRGCAPSAMASMDLDDVCRRKVLVIAWFGFSSFLFHWLQSRLERLVFRTPLHPNSLFLPLYPVLSPVLFCLNQESKHSQKTLVCVRPDSKCPFALFFWGPSFFSFFSTPFRTHWNRLGDPNSLTSHFKFLPRIGNLSDASFPDDDPVAAKFRGAESEDSRSLP